TWVALSRPSSVAGGGASGHACGASARSCWPNGTAACVGSSPAASSATAAAKSATASTRSGTSPASSGSRRARAHCRADSTSSSMSDSAALGDGIDLPDYVGVLVGVALLGRIGARLPFRRGGPVGDTVDGALLLHLPDQLGVGRARLCPLALENTVQAGDHRVALRRRQ